MIHQQRVKPATAGLSFFLVAAVVIAVVPVSADERGPFTLVADEHGMILKTPDGRTVFRYMTKRPTPTELTANSVCCLYPLKTPSGEDTVDFAPSDHRHHRGAFLTWHNLQGKKAADFWGWGQFAPTKDRVIQNRGVKLVRTDAKCAEVSVQNDWIAEGDVLIAEDLAIKAREAKHAFVVDLDDRFTPTGDVTLGQSAFGGLCIKARKGGKAAYSDPKGEVTLASPHHLKPETDWPAAAWYDYTTRLDGGKTLGVAVLDHPGNPPTAWHNVAAIAMVNPCIVAAGPVTIKQGQSLRLRYRLVVHDGPPPTDLLQELVQEWRGRNGGYSSRGLK